MSTKVGKKRRYFDESADSVDEGLVKRVIPAACHIFDHFAWSRCIFFIFSLETRAARIPKFFPTQTR
jgi:hypothetical protein